LKGKTPVHKVADQRALGVARIPKREKPGDLPVQLLTELELVTNLSAARVLGVTVPRRRRRGD